MTRYGGLLVLMSAVTAAGQTTRPAVTRAPRGIADRASCSSLCQLKHPIEEAMKTITGLGYKYVDLSALPWAPHINVANLLKDFDAEAGKVEAALEANGLKVSNLTYNPLESVPFEEYKAQFAALAKLAKRLQAPVINIMAPGVKTDREDMVKKLRILQQIAKDSGIILTVETHVNQITEKPADALQLCKDVPGLGLTLDPSHYYAGPNQGKSFKELYPHVKGTGFRAGGMTWATIQSPWGTGPIDFEQIVRDLEKAGYKGYYVTEYLEGHAGEKPVDAVEESRKFLLWIRRAFGDNAARERSGQ